MDKNNCCRICLEDVNLGYSLLEECTISELIKTLCPEVELILDSFPLCNQCMQMLKNACELKKKLLKMLCGVSFESKFNIFDDIKEEIDNIDTKLFDPYLILDPSEFNAFDDDSLSHIDILEDVELNNKTLHKDESTKPPPKKLKHPVNNSKYLQCAVCNEEFTGPAKLIKHSKEIHKDDMPFKCHHCKKAYSTKKGLKFHEVSHSDNKPFSCDFCLKAFHLKVYLLAHIRVHVSILQLSFVNLKTNLFILRLVTNPIIVISRIALNPSAIPITSSNIN